MPRLPVTVVAKVVEAGRVSESNMELLEVRVRDGRVRGRDSNGESPSSGSLTTTGLSYSIV